MDGLKLVKIRQSFEAPVVAGPEERVFEETARLLSESGLRGGASVAITAGSRGIRGIRRMCEAAARAAREAGCEPFFFASMGSHGRGTPEGQREVLESLDITEEGVGAPVSCSERVVRVGETSGPLAGLPVYFAEEAAEAGAVLALNRIKPHTSFRGPRESGLMKMLAVGAGRAEGAAMVHGLGWENMAGAIQSIGNVILDELPVLGGIAVVQNGREEPAVVEGVPAARLLEREPELLEVARGLLPRLPVDGLDALVVRRMGKDYSGTGMDTNVIGRLRLEGLPEPESPAIRHLGVLDLTESSRGNATGVGLADFTTRRLVEKIDREATYLNCLTSGSPTRAAIPMTLEDDRELLEAIWQSLKLQDGSGVRLAVIEDTLHLEELWLSEAAAKEALQKEGIEAVGDPTPLGFDPDGALSL